jgi:hypothetical protein
VSTSTFVIATAAKLGVPSFTAGEADGPDAASFWAERTQGCDSVYGAPIVRQPRPAPPPHDSAGTYEPQSLGVRLAAKSSPYQVLSGDSIA